MSRIQNPSLGFMNEVLPVLCGCGVGFLIGTSIRLKLQRYFCCLGLSALLGFAATVATGEWKIGWEFVLIDFALVAACSISVIALGDRIKRSLHVGPRTEAVDG